MKTEQRSEYLSRDEIMTLLSDQEVARVTDAETASSLTNGEEYLDLEQLHLGVCTSHGTTATPMGRVLPKRAVHAATWAKIVAGLAGERPTPTA